MHWILQNNLFNEDAYQVLLDTLVRFDIPYSIHKVIPFIGELHPSFESQCPIDGYKNVICMGSYSLRHAAKAAGWYPGVFDLEQQNFNVQMQHWGDEMLNSDAVVSRFEDANFTEDLMFIRPIEDSKVFAGTVMSKDEFYEWKRKVCVLEEDYGNSLTKNTLIQVCKPKKIYAEYRFWIVKGRIVTASLYKRGDRVIYSSDVDQHVYNYVKQILRMKDGGAPIICIDVEGWRPDEAFCIDVCETPEGMRVVEIGTINSCGFYAANLTDLVLSLESAFNEK